MIPLPWPVVIFFLAIYLAIALAIFIIYALLINLVSRTRVYLYLLSSALIGLAVYIATTIIGLEVLTPLSWVNEVPQDLRTAMWDHLHIISCGTGVIAITLWQLMVRLRRHAVTSTST